MLHPDTTLHSSSPCSPCRAGESKLWTSSAQGSGGKHAVFGLLLQTGAAFSNYCCQSYEYEHEQNSVCLDP